MIFINALKLIELAVENEVLSSKDGHVVVYLTGSEESEEGWYLMDKHAVAQDLMNDEKGQNAILKALKEKNIEFVPIKLPY